jgi:hypothetical protein
MSAIRSHAERVAAFFGGDEGPIRCFFCGAVLGYPFIYWMGSDGSIGLHRECFFELVIRLARDARELSPRNAC